ncbi:MAG: rRNA maturation RNase YbeY [Candidatus Delongbacteria bacterium]|nr:rRNA maturation RNase YbeY [Candidatus Delongbacteria bacterium]
MKLNNIVVENHSDTKVVLRNILRAVDFYKKIARIEIVSLSISLIDDPEMERINITHLGHEGSTDIITFDYREPDNKDNNKIDAELIICPGQAKLNAKEYGVPLKQELMRLLFHGLLHLTGYDDTDAVKRRKMKKREDEILNLWNQYNLSLSNNNGAING